LNALALHLGTSAVLVLAALWEHLSLRASGPPAA